MVMTLTFVADVGMRASELDYELPPELIAQRPLERRDESRLLVYDRATAAVEHARFSELPQLLAPQTLVAVNDTRVMPARLLLERPTGGKAEVLLLERVDGDVWEALARPSRRLRSHRLPRRRPTSAGDVVRQMADDMLVFVDPKKGRYEGSPDADWRIGCEEMWTASERQGVRAAVKA